MWEGCAEVKPLDVLKIAEELGDMYKVAEKKPDVSSPASMQVEISTRSAYIARSAHLMADTQKLIDFERGEFAALHNKKKTNATIFKELLAGHLAEYTRLHNLAERLNASLTHQINGLRSTLSFETQLVGGKRV